MAALITTAIPLSNLEIIRNHIGAILALELPAQWVLDNSIPKVSKVYIERTVPIDNTEIPVVNVGIDQATWLNHSQPSVQSEYGFNIDIYNNSLTTGQLQTERGDVLAMYGVQRLVAIIRAILQAPVYNTLGIAPGTVGGVYVQSAMSGSRSAANGFAADKDAAHDVIAQVKVMVRSGELNVITATAVPLEQATTAITLLTNDLQQSDKGFYYDFDPVA